MIDLSPIRRTMVDGEKTARVDGGALMGDVVQETQLYGLVVSAGIVSHTGVGGLALEGGVVSRKDGMSVDNMLSAESVTAKGAYVNFVSQEGEDRLKKIKFVWDPDIFFRINQNIKPSPQ